MVLLGRGHGGLCPPLIDEIMDEDRSVLWSVLGMSECDNKSIVPNRYLHCRYERIYVNAIHMYRHLWMDMTSMHG